MADRALEVMARDVAPELDRILNEWLSSDMLLGSKEYQELERFLWDNKIGLLRFAQRCADLP